MGWTGWHVTPEDLAAQAPLHAETAGMREKSVSRLRRARWLAVLGGLAAGLCAFGVGEATYKFIPPVLVQQTISGNKMMLPNLATNNVAATRNGALAFGVLGICLGGGLGMAGGLARRSTAATVTAGLLGSLVGLALGVGLSLALLPLFFRAQDDYFEYDIILSLLMHGSIWGPLGAVAGLAFAVGLGEPRRVGQALAAGMVGGVLATIAFELIGAALFIAAKTGEPISETWPTRLMARLLVTLGTAAAVALLWSSSQPIKASRRPETPTPSPES